MAGTLKIGNKTIATHNTSSNVITLNSEVVFPAGHILQTTQGTYNINNSDATTSTSASKVVSGSDTLYTHTISSMTAGNNVLINMSFAGNVTQSGTTSGGGAWHIFRDTTKIYTSTSDYFMGVIHSISGITVYNWNYVNLSFLDTGATGTSHAYFLGYSSNGGASVSVFSNVSSPPFVCILQEIQS